MRVLLPLIKGRGDILHLVHWNYEGTFTWTHIINCHAFINIIYSITLLTPRMTWLTSWLSNSNHRHASVYAPFIGSLKWTCRLVVLWDMNFWLYWHFEHALWNLKFGDIKFPNFISMCHKIMILWHKFQISYLPTHRSLSLGILQYSFNSIKFWL